ncbi:tetratricopeptide repeat protein [Haloimpatiens sp. FM7330]|uniref:tetratricopeptide repeat protein n=1 Tax=Haloimpatiens sp. FM7330 TaxID=3298610 RepID=UPI00364581BE
MDIKTYYAEKLSKMLFLNIKKEKLKDIFNIELKEDIYMPVAAEDLAERVKKGDFLQKIPIGFFVEGMYYVLGADSNFKYNEYYKTMILNTIEADQYIKGRIAKEVKKKCYEDAYILLKGLTYIEITKENYLKMFLLCDKLRIKSKMYKDEALEIIEKAKQFEDFPEPYFYEALVLKDEGDFQKALFCINTYLSKGGEETKEVSEFKTSLKIVNDYDKGKDLVCEDPDDALKLLIPLIDDLGDNAEIYYYIAVAYRNLQNPEKAIYYLNEALAIDNAVVEVINELGINYAAIGEFEKAISYFRSAFQYTGSIEICTNLVMCYLNIKDIKQAKVHLKLAKEIDANDEVVLQLEKMLNVNE